MELRSMGEDAYFAASNSTSGFHSYYKECFDAPRIRRLYAIKGGPGTGKSRFLREVSRYGERFGWGVEYIYCSSDPESLDGIILSKGEACMALLDATAPHVYEPTHPGVREEIVNLGQFWDSQQLSSHAAEIASLNERKGAAWARAYRYLSAYGEIQENRDALVRPYLRRDALQSLAEKLLASVPMGENYEAMPALIGSVGMRGSIAFDTYFAKATRVIAIEDCRGSAAYLMHCLGELAVRRRQRIRISHDPLLPSVIDGMFFMDTGLAILVLPTRKCPSGAKLVRLRRFVRVGEMKEIRGEVIFAERMKRAMLAGATEALQKVREAHFALEEIYMSAMDFSAKEEFTEAFCRKIFDLPCQAGENVLE